MSNSVRAELLSLLKEISKKPRLRRLPKWSFPNEMLGYIVVDFIQSPSITPKEISALEEFRDTRLNLSELHPTIQEVLEKAVKAGHLEIIPYQASGKILVAKEHISSVVFQSVNPIRLFKLENVLNLPNTALVQRAKREYDILLDRLNKGYLIFDKEISDLISDQKNTIDNAYRWLQNDPISAIEEYNTQEEYNQGYFGDSPALERALNELENIGFPSISQEVLEMLESDMEYSIMFDLE